MDAQERDPSPAPEVTPWQLAFEEEKRRVRARRRVAFEVENEAKPSSE